MGDEPKPLTEEELGRLVAQINLISPATSGRRQRTTALFDVDLVERLVDEVGRLRRLVIDAEPHVPDNEATRAMDLPARLKAEGVR